MIFQLIDDHSRLAIASHVAWGGTSEGAIVELMGLPTYGFGGGRLDAWEPDDGTWWGPEV